jgi:hypothetical protein
LSQIQGICIILNLNKFTIQQEQNKIAYLKTNIVCGELRRKDTEAVESSCEIDIVIPFYEYRPCIIKFVLVALTFTFPKDS